MLSTKLATLLSVAETLNFTKSAAVLSLTQPAISQHIRALEQQLGIRIFNRTQKEIKLTPEGEIAVAYAKKMRALYQNLLQDLDDEQRNLKRLVVGVTPTAESNSISQVLALYGSEMPNLHITIISDSINNIYEKLRNYEIDLAIVEGSLGDEEFGSILLDTDYLALAVANDNALSKKSMATLDELRREKLVLRLPDSGTRMLFEQSLARRGDSINSFNVILEVDNNNTIMDLVAANFGVSILSRKACEEYVRKKQFGVLPVESLSMVREINIVYQRDFAHTNVLDDIARLYNETAVAPV